jgi:hydrogenase expression/formation protein HypC
MCLAIPMRVVELDLPMGTVELEGVRRAVHLGFIDDVALGDYVLVHAGCAVEKLRPEQAEEDLELLRTLLRLSEEESAEGRTSPGGPELP